MKKAAAIDFETFPFGPARMAPKPICMSWAEEGREGLSHCKEPETLERVISYLEKAAQGEIVIVGQNVAYDWCCAMAEWPGLIPFVFEAYDADGVTDTMIRQKLWDNAHGQLRGWTNGATDKWVKIGYALDDLFKRHTGQDFPKLYGVRTTFGDLYDKPIDEWPEGHRKYAGDDAPATLIVYEAQEIEGTQIPIVFNDQFRQARKALSLQLASVWGMRTDADNIRKLEQAQQARLEEARAVLIPAGLARPNGSRNMKLAAERMAAALSNGPKTPTGRPKIDEDACLESGDPSLIALSNYGKAQNILTGNCEDFKAGCELPIHTRFDTMLTTGRVSSSAPNLENLRREPGIRECFAPREGFVYCACDFSKAELHSLAQVCLTVLGKSRLAEALNAGTDPHLMMGAAIAGIPLEEALRRKHDKDVKKARQDAKCFHPDTEALTKRGWVKIGELRAGEEVAAAYPGRHGTSTIRWEIPTDLTRRPCPPEGLVRVRNKGIDLRVTKDHRMLAFGQDGSPYVTSPEFFEKARTWAGAGVVGSGVLPGGFINWSLLRLAVATQADGSYTEKGVRFGFTKKRKILRMRILLKGRKGWSETRQSNGTAAFYLTGALADGIKRMLDPDKTFPWWMAALPLSFREAILEEARHWDAHQSRTGRRYVYTTTQKKNADVLQAVASVSGKKSRMVCHKRNNEKHQPLWSLSVSDHSYARGGSVKISSYEFQGDVVCLSVPSSFVLVRDGGVPVVTGQCVNFGFPGGLGAEGFVAFAKSNYGAIFTKEQGERFRQLWLDTWPEMPEYFEWVRSQVGEGAATIAQLFSDRLRGACSYTVAANTMFQGHTADGKGIAIWRVSKACYALPDHVLFGSRVVDDIHDELLLEVIDDDRTHDRAVAVKDEMEKGFNSICPDVPVKAEPVLMRRWTKSAEPLLRDGRMVPWEDR
jgi:hypothetical protein